ncbi:MAG: NADP-dependent oxidoreductase [Alphaproteobacteria bacterium]|nr:NADP-dependent oxidoreductase [Alphaproteobacteria bacterium]
MSDENRHVVLRRRPDPDVRADLFEMVDAPMPTIGDGEMLIRVIWLSLDPAMRGWIADAPNYSRPVAIGAPMTGFTVGQVVESRHPRFPVGTIVQGRQGWRRYAVSDGSDIDRIVDAAQAPISTALHVLGMNGATAYVGLIDVCRVKPGDTVVVTTAAGAVGSMVGQIAKVKGARAVGVAGGPEKVATCLDEFGYDAAIDYRASVTIGPGLDEAAPDGIDCFFDNVGGAQFDAVMDRINVGARIAICGTIGMPSFPLPTGPRPNRQLLVKRARIEGFLILDHYDRFSAIVDELAAWYRDGHIRYREDVTDGLEGAADALVRLLSGRNTGKALVRVGADQ